MSMMRTTPRAPPPESDSPPPRDGDAFPLPRRRRAIPAAGSGRRHFEERDGQDDVDEREQSALEPVRFAIERDEGTDADGGRHGSDLERREDEVHRLAEHGADDHQDR